MAAAVPRHGTGRVPGDPDDDRRATRAGRTAGLHGQAGQLDAMDLRLGWHGHGRAELRMGAGDTRAGAARRCRRTRSVDAHDGAERCRAGRSQGGRGVRCRGRAVRVHTRWCVPGVRHGRDRDRRRVPTPRHGHGVRHRRSRGARADRRRQAGRGQRSRRARAQCAPSPAARHRRAGDGDARRRSGDTARTCPSVTWASSCCAARQ